MALIRWRVSRMLLPASPPGSSWARSSFRSIRRLPDRTAHRKLHQSHSRSTTLLCPPYRLGEASFMKVVANIDFDGDCREAFTTYAGILGGEIRAMLSHRDMPEMTEGDPE